MKIHILSDIHLEFGKMPRSYIPPECDVVVLAGDIAVGRAGVTWALETFAQPVIYIAGNHEFYRRSLRLYDELREKCEGTHVRFLENDTAEIDGVAFIGATLWTDFDLFGNPEAGATMAREGMTDFRVIEGMSVQTWLDHNAFSRGYIEGALLRHKDKQRVVVTHHAPCARSVPERFADDGLSPAFASKFLESLPHLPDLWLHGHTHDSFDYVERGTRVVCNPRGYAGYELNPAFEIGKVVEI